MTTAELEPTNKPEIVGPFVKLSAESLKLISEAIRQEIPQDAYGSVLSATDLNSGQSLRTSIDVISDQAVLFWVDGPAAYLNRSLHFELRLTTSLAKVDVYEFDKNLPIDNEVTTERYRQPDGDLPAYLLVFSDTSTGLDGNPITFHEDGRVYTWKYDPAVRQWGSTPHLMRAEVVPEVIENQSSNY